MEINIETIGSNISNSGLKNIKNERMSKKISCNKSEIK